MNPFFPSTNWLLNSAMPSAFPLGDGDARAFPEALNEGYRAVVAEIAPMRAQLEDSIASMEMLRVVTERQ